MLKRLTVKRIDPVSAGKVIAVIYGVIGIIGGMFMGAVMALGSNVGPNRPGPGPVGGLILGGVFVLMMPIIYAVMGFLIGLLIAVIHNVTVSYIGGLVVEVDDESEDDVD